MNRERFTAYRDLHREVRQLRRQLENMESFMFSPHGQRFTATPHAAHGGGHTMDDMVCGHIELKEEIDRKVLELTRELVELERAVETLENPIERAVMRYRYFEEMNWAQVCEAIHYSRPQANRYHKAAMAKLCALEPKSPAPKSPEAEEDPCEGCVDRCCWDCAYGDL